MKRLLLVLGCCAVASAAVAQADLPETSDSLRVRFSQLNKAYAKAPNNVEALYNLAMFYFDNSNPMRNLPMAMMYISRAEERQVKLLETNEHRELSRLVRSDITITTIRQARKAIAGAALNAVKGRTDMSREELEMYYAAFGSDINIGRMLRQRWIKLEYEECLKKGTVESYYGFIEKYPGLTESEELENRLAVLAPTLFEGVFSEHQADLIVRRYSMSPSVKRAADKWKSRKAYAVARSKDDEEAYEDYLNKFPGSDESQQARDRVEELHRVAYSKCRTAMDYAVFANNYPANPLADTALEQVRVLLDKDRDAITTRYYLEHFKYEPNTIDVYSRYYSWYAEEGNGALVRQFDMENPQYPFGQTVEDDLEMASTIDTVNLLERYSETEYERYASYVRKFTGKNIAIVPLQRMIQGLVASRNYPAALERVRKFDLCFDSVPVRREYLELQGILSAPLTGRKSVSEFSATYHVMNPSVNEADGNLYFTRVGSSRHICYAVKEGNQWLPVGEVLFDGPVDNDGLTLFGFCEGGSRMLLGQGGNIMMAEKNGDLWRVTDIPPYPVNTDYLETDAYMLPDGSGMLLASDRPGGYNLQKSGSYFHGDTAYATDLYFIPYVNNVWGEPVNLGANINTPYSERSPILSRNLKTLYFVTDGRGGLGFGDIYVATRTSLLDWTSWSTPKNAGKEINTGFDESGLSFGPGEKRIYLAANSADSLYSCYSIPTWHETSNPHRTYIVDMVGMEGVSPRVRVADMQQQTIIQIVDTLDETGAVTLDVHKEKTYAVMGDAGNYFVPAIVLNPGDRERQQLRGYFFSELVAMDKPVPLCSVGFDVSTGELLPIAQLQLEQLAQFLSDNPQGIVEVVVDVAGIDDALAYQRSLARGRVVRDYLTGRGIDSTRIIVSAYGNSNVKKQGMSGVSVRFREQN